MVLSGRLEGGSLEEVGRSATSRDTRGLVDTFQGPCDGLDFLLASLSGGRSAAEKQLKTEHLPCSPDTWLSILEPDLARVPYLGGSIESLEARWLGRGRTHFANFMVGRRRGIMSDCK